MKKIILTLSMITGVLAAGAQQQKGRVSYERTVQMQFQMFGLSADAGAPPPPPPAHKDKLEVLFGNGRSLRRNIVEEEAIPDGFAVQGRTAVGVMMMGDADNITYTDFSRNQVVNQREFGPKTYIVTDSLTKLNWKLTGETKTILGYVCQQALSQRIGKRIMTNVENGQLKNQEVPDTATITAWFTPAIPVPAGPDYQGQLPGLILAVDINNGATVYQAIEISPDVNLSTIKEPSKGKKITEAEFTKMRDKMMSEMQLNMSPVRATRM
ncbi:GLPGLI family protein [Chitinophaga arvensicola]|uniref:GLPGLI family protein n=1 Tax=Chitinophaga arvensicola TaxID=29529 RepID=A0A1I0S9M5_9BACT|nr:GLPGLI family protein [Chitinophaga arvensicola]SEW51755.1 GLPGLI family protein [Chitinophaga arvensicola]